MNAAEHVEREFEAYRKDDHEARSILDLAVEENRSTTPEEDQRFDALLASAEAHKARADKLAQANAADAQLGETIRNLVRPDAGSGAPSDGNRLNGRLIDAMLEVHRAVANGDDPGEIVLNLGIDLEKRAIADFSDNGALYTTDFATQVAIYQRTASPWIDLASVINADNGRPLNLPKLTVDPAIVTPGEGTAITENSGTIGSAALTTTAYKGLSYISQEAEQDELIGVLPLFARQQGRQIGLSFGSAVTVAVLAAASNGGTAGGTGGFGTAAGAFVGYEDLITLKYGRQAPYRTGGQGAWVMSNGMIQKAKKWRDANGQYLLAPSLGAGAPGLIDGDPVYEDPFLATPASATKSVLYGDIRSALVIKQMALRVAVSTDFKFDTDQIAVKSVYRAGAAIPDPAAIAYLVSANT